MNRTKVPPSNEPEVELGHSETFAQQLQREALEQSQSEIRKKTQERPEPKAADRPTTVWPPTDKRPCFGLYPQAQTVGKKTYPPGVYYHDVEQAKGKEATLSDVQICAPLRISAITADGQDSNYGRLLEFQSARGKSKNWAMPMELLAGDGTDALSVLLKEGLAVSYKNRRLILNYIAGTDPVRFLNCATCTGWADSDTFVLPDEIIGRRQGEIWFQSASRCADYTKTGTLEGWRRQVAALAVGNPFLMLAIAFSLSGPLLQALNFTGLGMHFYGDTTMGKSTVLEAGGSSWGGRAFRHAWRATANGMEGLGTQHTDTLLVMDELGLVSPAELDEAAYFLLNGSGKVRANKYGEAKPSSAWRVAILSSGEPSIRVKLADGGISLKAGQSLRILDIPVSGKYGLFDDLHGHKDGAQLSDAIRGSAELNHGHAGPLLVAALLKAQADGVNLPEMHVAFVEKFGSKDAQERRGASTFALAALAGEIANSAGIVPWTEGDAFAAAHHVFNNWLSARESSYRGSEHASILRAVSDFIDRHSDSRFSNIKGDLPEHERIVYNRAGYWDEPGTERIYLFTADGLREATKRHDFNRVLRALDEAGAFYKTDKTQKAVTTRTPDGRTPRLYWINPAPLDFPQKPKDRTAT